jgi:hypothetical protein
MPRLIVEPVARIVPAERQIVARWPADRAAAQWCADERFSSSVPAVPLR